MSAWEIVCIILNFAGALAVFLFGMKLMSEGLQKVAGNGMRNLLSKITNNPVSGILTGTAVTTAIQSSSATTVMVVSFVNAGLLSLYGAVAVIMGANIGTTVTAWIISLFGLGESSGYFNLPMFLGAVSLCFSFSKRSRVKSVGELVIGLALLLVGMGLLQNAMPDLQQYPGFLEALASLSHWGYLSLLIFIVVGALLTCLVQASAAMMAITLVMCYNGWITFDVAVALVMGQNIGTTITANIAAMVANANGKKAARAHLVFNVIGVILTLVVFYPLMNLIDTLTLSIAGVAPHFDETLTGEALASARAASAQVMPLSLSLFHTFFNVANTIILAFFIPQIIKIVDWMVKTPVESDDDETPKLKFIAGGYLDTPELNLQLARKEIEDFSKRVLRMYTFLPGLRSQNDEEFNQTFEHIKKYEAITDRMEMEIAKFLTKISEGDLSREGSQMISSMLRIIDNLESIGDTMLQIAIHRRNKREDEVHFDQGLNDNLSRMTDLVEQSLKVMDANLQTDYTKINLHGAYEAEEAINAYRDELRARHLNALKLGVYSYSVGSAYSGIYALYEKLGDYVINVSEAIDNSQKVANSEEEAKGYK